MKSAYPVSRLQFNTSAVWRVQQTPQLRFTCCNCCREAKLAKSGKSRLNVDNKKIETLEEGQTIKLSIASAGANSGGRTKRSTRLGGGLKKPSGGSLRKPTSQPSIGSSATGEEDLLGGLSSSMASTSISAPAPAPSSGGDEWEPF
jgi:hypothetical protein